MSIVSFVTLPFLGVDPPGNFVELCDVTEVDNEVDARVKVEDVSIEPVVVDNAAVETVVVVEDVVVKHGVVVEVVVVDVIVEVVLLVVVDEVLQVHKEVLFKIVLICT